MSVLTQHRSHLHRFLETVRKTDPGRQAEARSESKVYPLLRGMQGHPETCLLRTASRLEDYSGSVSVSSPSAVSLLQRVEPLQESGEAVGRLVGRRWFNLGSGKEQVLEKVVCRVLDDPPCGVRRLGLQCGAVGGDGEPLEFAEIVDPQAEPFDRRFELAVSGHE